MFRTRLDRGTEHIRKKSSGHQPSDGQIQPFYFQKRSPNKIDFGKNPANEEKYRKKYADYPIKDDFVIFRNESIWLKYDRVQTESVFFSD